MPAAREDLRDFLRGEPDCILVEVTGAVGSTPRDTDAWMLVSKSRSFSTIGGGQLEYMAIDQARRALRQSQSVATMSIPLGPEIGQCCGGRVGLYLRSSEDIDRLALSSECDAYVRVAIFYEWPIIHPSFDCYRRGTTYRKYADSNHSVDYTDARRVLCRHRSQAVWIRMGVCS